MSYRSMIPSFRSSLSQIFCKIGTLNNFPKFRQKYLQQSPSPSNTKSISASTGISSKQYSHSKVFRKIYILKIQQQLSRSASFSLLHGVCTATLQNCNPSWMFSGRLSTSFQNIFPHKTNLGAPIEI